MKYFKNLLTKKVVIFFLIICAFQLHPFFRNQ